MNPCGFEFPGGGGCHLTEHKAGVAAALNVSRAPAPVRSGAVKHTVGTALPSLWTTCFPHVDDRGD